MSGGERSEGLQTRSETLERISDGVLALDEDLEYTYANQRAAQLVGRGRESIVGKHVWDVFPEAVGTTAQEKIERAVETGEQVTYERYNETLDQWFEARIYPDEDGISIFFTDVTDRKEREEDIERANRKLQALVENTTEAIYIKDPDGTYQFVNQAAADVFGLAPDEVVGKTDEELFDAESAAAIRALDESILESGEVVTEETVRSVDGEQYVFLDNKFPYRDEDGEAVGIMGISRDVTDRKERERRLERAETLFQNAQDALFLVDVGDGGEDFQLERVNPAYESITGLSNEELRGETLGDAFGEADAARIEGKYRECVDRREPLEYEERLSIPEEGSHWETRIAPVVVDGEVVQLVGATRNITERKERERHFRRLHSATRDLVQAETPQAVAEVTSRAAEEILDLPMNGVHLYDDEADGLVPTAVTDYSRDVLDDPPVLDRGIAWDAYRSGEPHVSADIRAESEVYDPETEMRSEIHLPLGDHGVLILSSPDTDAFDESDVTLGKILASNAETALDQIESERELRETTNTLEAMIRSSPDGIAMVDEDLTVTLWNRAAEEMFGWTEAQVVGGPLPFVPESKGDAFESFVAEVAEGNVKQGVETALETRDGELLEVRLSSARVTADDELVGYMGTFEDISQRREYERRLKAQRDNLELLNQMVSHDVRNDLEMVLGYAELLEDRATDEQRRFAKEILAGARAAVEITESARDLAEAMLQSENDRERIPLRTVLESQVAETRATYDAATITVDGTIPATNVLADEMLPSVFRNLLKNAIQHNDEDVPEVCVSTELDDDDVVVTVADNGPGIPDGQKAEIFGRAEKGLESNGTGIGLYLVDTLVEQYDGDVLVTDNDPKGAVFSVRLERA